MKKAAIVQARTGSTRLPGKVLLDLAGRPVLARVIERLRECRKLDEIIVATSSRKGDDAIEELCLELATPCFRGSEDDVLDRFYQAARSHKADTIIRITADCPLIDPALIDRMTTLFTELDPPADYLSNTLKRTYPRGLDAEIFSFQALEKAWRKASHPAEREHVTPYIYRRPEEFRLAGYAAGPDLSHHRWTLDTPEDYALIRALYEALYRPGQSFGMMEIVNFLDTRPELYAVNRKIVQKETGL
jgi:spore coat polysaccharide biosynthesis protein SpsF